MSGAKPATSAAAAAVNGLANTEARRIAACSSVESRPRLQSSTARSDRCRWSIRDPPVSRSSGSASPRSSPSRPRVATRAAASSIASAIPSSRRQMLVIRRWSFGYGDVQPVIDARSRNRAVASLWSASAPWSPSSDMPGTGNTNSKGTRSRARLVASTTTRGQAASSRSTRALTPSSRCSQLSSTRSTSAPASLATTVSVGDRPGCSPNPKASASAAPTIAGSVTGTRST